MKKIFIFTILNFVILGNYSFANDIQKPCKEDGFEQYATCILTEIDAPSEKGGSIDIRDIEKLLPKDTIQAVIIADINASRVSPMKINLLHFDDKDINVSPGEYQPDHLLIPQEGTQRIILSTNNAGKTWDMKLRIQASGYLDNLN